MYNYLVVKKLLKTGAKNRYLFCAVFILKVLQNVPIYARLFKIKHPFSQNIINIRKTPIDPILEGNDKELQNRLKEARVDD